MKIQISIDEDLLTKIDDFADKHYMTRSAVLQQGALSYIQSKELLSLLPEMSVSLKNMANKSELSDTDLDHLRAMENVVTMFRATI